MKYLLDSDTAIDVMRRPRAAAANRFLSLSPTDMAVSIVTKAEILVGPHRKKSVAIEVDKVRRFLDRVAVLSFDDECVEEFARIAAHLFDIGSPVDGMDIQIASTARVHNLTLVTGNASDYGRVPDLTIENWITDRT